MLRYLQRLRGPASDRPRALDWSRANIARLSLALVAATYGSNYACVKLLDRWVGTAAEAAVLRFSVSAAAALPTLAHFARTHRQLVSLPVARDGLAIGGLFGLGYMVQAVALETSLASTQAFLLSLSVLVVPLLDRIVGRTPQPERVWLAACMAVLGICCLEGGGLASATLSMGDVVGLLQAFFFGAGYWVCERAIRRHRTPGSDGLALSVALTAWNLLAVLALALAWLALDRCCYPLPTGGVSTQGLGALAVSMASSPLDHLPMIAAVLWTGLVTTAVCAFVEAAVLTQLSSSEAMVVFATEPVWGAFLSWAMLGEDLGPATLVGGLLMVAACVISGSEDADPRGAAVRARKWFVKRK